MAEMPDFDRLEVAVKDICDEYQRLKAIVDRLPKTADGVPIVPGDTAYVRFGKRVEEETGFLLNVRDCELLQMCRVFSTRAAAEAFLKGGE